MSFKEKKIMMEIPVIIIDPKTMYLHEEIVTGKTKDEEFKLLMSVPRSEIIFCTDGYKAVVRTEDLLKAMIKAKVATNA